MATTNRVRAIGWWLSLLICVLLIPGCTSNAGSGALLGGAGGAALGAVIGHQSHGHTAGGALIGAAAGAATGALIGNEIDRQQQAAYRQPPYLEPPPPAATVNGAAPPPTTAPTAAAPTVREPETVVERPYLYGQYVYVDPVPPPPPPYVEVVPVRPYPWAVWTPGHWVRGHRGWIWVRGYWR